MTKQEATVKYNAYLAAAKANKAYNDFQNEGGEGYEKETDVSVVNEIIAAGYCPNFATKKVYDKDDFEATKTAWNNAVRKIGGNNIKRFEAESKVSYSLIMALKGFYK